MKANIIKRVVGRLTRSGTHRRVTYSQCGEDVIISFALNMLEVKSPTYLDIGTNHATLFNNTYLFYKRGCHGICIEPNPALCRAIAKARPRDLCLNVGIAPGEEQKLPFYVLDSSMLCTFDRETAERCAEQHGHRIIETIDVPTMPARQLIERHCQEVPNLVSLDTEGHDLAILEDWDFEHHRPEVFCIETVEYDPGRAGCKIPAIGELLDAQDYFPYADTYINTIFVDGRKWRS